MDESQRIPGTEHFYEQCPCQPRYVVIPQVCPTCGCPSGHLPHTWTFPAVYPNPNGTSAPWPTTLPTTYC